MSVGSYWMSQMNLEISPIQVVWPRVVTIAGLSMIFAPLNVAAYMYTPKALRGAAVGLFSLLRNEGGSVGTSMAQTIHERRDQFHSLRLGESLDPLNPTVNSYLEQAQAFFYRTNGRCRGGPGYGSRVAFRAARATVVFIGLFRCVLGGGCPGCGPHVAGRVHEALGRRKGSAHRRRVNATRYRERRTLGSVDRTCGSAAQASPRC